jgi:hypothetical protein
MPLWRRSGAAAPRAERSTPSAGPPVLVVVISRATEHARRRHMGSTAGRTFMAASARERVRPPRWRAEAELGALSLFADRRSLRACPPRAIRVSAPSVTPRTTTSTPGHRRPETRRSARSAPLEDRARLPARFRAEPRVGTRPQRRQADPRALGGPHAIGGRVVLDRNRHVTDLAAGRLADLIHRVCGRQKAWSGQLVELTDVPIVRQLRDGDVGLLGDGRNGDDDLRRAGHDAPSAPARR